MTMSRDLALMEHLGVLLKQGCPIAPPTDHALQKMDGYSIQGDKQLEASFGHVEEYMAFYHQAEQETC